MESTVAEPLAVDAPVDTPVDAVDNVDTPSTDDTHPEGFDQADTSQDGGAPKSLIGEVKPIFAALKAEGKLDGKMERRIMQAIIRDGKVDPDLPYTAAQQAVKEVQALAYPGSEGKPISELLPALKTEITAWRDFDVKISNGDPSVITELAEVAPEGFQNLVPAALESYARLNPDAYSTLVTKAVVTDLDSSEVPLQLRMMETFLKDWPVNAQTGKPEFPQIYKVVVDGYNSFVGWTNNLRTLASKEIKAVKGPEPKQGDKPDQQGVAAAREEALTRQLWNAQSNPYGVTMIQKEATRLAGNVSEVDQKRIRLKVDEELAARFAVDQKFRDNMNGYVKSRNYEGYRRTLHSKYALLIPGAVSRAIADLGIKAVKAGTKVQQGPQNNVPRGTQKPAGAKPATAGAENWERIPGHPRSQNPPLRIDLTKTTTEMLTGKPRKAYLVGGRRVQWA